mgnify:CR=1 FL=1
MVILTRNSILEYLGEVTVAPVTSTIRDIPSEVLLSQQDGMHKKGDLSSIELAASALTSAVEAGKSLFVEFKGIDAFPYDGFIKRYPPRLAPMFSKMA